jgi:hypothetical protein
MFGGQEELARHSLVAVTGATDLSEGRNLLTRDALVDELNGLPLGHFFRSFVEDAALRLVPVENRLDPHRQISRLSLHQRVLDVEEANRGRRYDAARFLPPTAGAAHHRGGGGGGGHAGGGPTGARDAATPEEMLRALRLGGCTQTVGRRPRDGRLVWSVECEVRE